MKSAILIIDMLNDYFQEGRLKEVRKDLCTNINDIVSWGRANNLQIIWVRQEFKADLSDAFLVMRKRQISKTIEHTEGAQLLKELAFKKNEVEIVKKRYSAFYNTNLEAILNKNNIKQLIICGINTHACVRMATIDAYQRDYEVIVANDCVNSPDEQHHKVSLNYLDGEISRVMSNKEIKSQIIIN